ncbi:MAG: T9SS type A sorting domain-containing protein, partial [Ignavibacteria bacterium]
RLTTTYPPVFTDVTLAFPTWKSWGVRLEGSAPAAGSVGNFCRTGINVPILDNSTARDSVLVNLGAGCTVLDVNVRIDNVAHTWDSDLNFYLQRGAIGSRIINAVGGSGDNFINTVLNDSAATPIASGTAPFTGSFRPSSPLTPFNGAFVSGYWRMVITDSAAGDQGALTAWCLVITYNCPVGGIQTIEIPNYYSLSQNYPNPFNPSTSIKFTMPQGDNVKLVIFDILGREVKTLVNEFRNAGSYEVNFDASSLSSGAYFYRLEAGEFTQTKKMLLVK